MPSREEGLLHLGLPEGRLGLGDPAETVRAGPEPPLDDDRAESVRELELDGRHDDRQLVLADVVLRPRLSEPDRLTDHPQEVHGDAPLLAQLVKGRVGEPREPIVRGHVHEGERERSVPNGGRHPLQRHPGSLQALHPARPEHVSRREPVHGREDPQPDQAIDVGGGDPGPTGHLVDRVTGHRSASLPRTMARTVGTDKTLVARETPPVSTSA
jgi:hypothetical protein